MTHYLEQELVDLMQSDDSIFRFLQGALDGVWYWDLDQPEHEWMDAAFWKTLGVDPIAKQHLAEEWQGLIHPDDLQLALANFKAHCDDENVPYDQIVRYRHADGSTVWVRCRGIVIRNADGVPRRMLGVHNDVTALKEAEEQSRKLADELHEKNTQLQAANDHLASSNEELRQFVRVASHDIRAPLRDVGTVMQWVLDDHPELAGESRELLQMGVGRVERLSRLLQDLLAHLKVGATQQEATMVDVAAAIDNALALASAEGFVVEKDIAVATMHTSKTALETCIRNLVSNAVKHHHRKTGTIVVRAERHGSGDVLLTVSDDGPGIAPQYREQVLDMFTTLKSRDEVEGSGMGLALVKKTVELYDGSITVQGNDKGGTDVVLQWPEVVG